MEVSGAASRPSNINAAVAENPARDESSVVAARDRCSRLRSAEAATIRRGGVPRRDYVRVVEPMFSIPDDLLDPNYVVRDLDAEDAITRKAAMENALAAEAENADALSINHHDEETNQPLEALLDAIRNPELNEEKQP